MRLTDKQKLVLVALHAYTRPPTSRQIADRLDRPRWRGRRWHRVQVHGILRRLERRGLVERRTENETIGAAMVATRVLWSLTSEGQVVALAAEEPSTMTTDGIRHLDK